MTKSTDSSSKEQEKKLQPQLKDPKYVSQEILWVRGEVSQWIKSIQTDLKDIAWKFYQNGIYDPISEFLESNLTLPPGFCQKEYDYLNTNINRNLFNISDEELFEGFETEMILERLYFKLKSQFPDLINDPEQCPWTWNDVGFIKARIRILCSKVGKDGFYGALFGSSIAQRGYSGSYKKMEVYDIMITGGMKSFDQHPRASLPMVYRAGDISDLKITEKRVYEMNDFTYMYDMGIGDPLFAFPDGIIKPALFQDYDLGSAFQEIRSSAIGASKSCSVM